MYWSIGMAFWSGNWPILWFIATCVFHFYVFVAFLIGMWPSGSTNCLILQSYEASVLYSQTIVWELLPFKSHLAMLGKGGWAWLCLGQADSHSISFSLLLCDMNLLIAGTKVNLWAWEVLLGGPWCQINEWQKRMTEERKREKGFVEKREGFSGFL